jgi:DNA polymerase-4
MILLVDMDAFFASVEQLHHPHLRGQPVIVCGDPERRGVVTTASYEARPFGVHAGMPLGQARRLCPAAHYVEGHPEKYVALSLQLLQLYLRFTPNVEPFSVDEAFLQVGSVETSLDEAARNAATIQRAIESQFHLGATIGVGPNKLIAKMASGVRKPRGLTALDVEGFRACFWPREVRELWGVGPKLAERMRSLGIQTIGELAHAPVHVLEGAFGVIGPQLREAACGHDETPLVPYHRGVDPKSMGHEVTLAEDTDAPQVLSGMLLRLSDQVARRLRSEGFVGRTVCLKLRDRRFLTRMRQVTLTEFTADHEVIYETVRRLWKELWKGDPIRLVGVTVSSLEAVKTAGQAELFDRDARSSSLVSALDRLRNRLGEASLVPAGSLSSISHLSHVPFGALASKAREPACRPPRS